MRWRDASSASTIPLEAEMWLQLGAHLFHQCSCWWDGPQVRSSHSVVIRAIRACEGVHDVSEWRDDTMTLADSSCAETNPKGQISQVMKKRHAKEKLDDDETLETFCNRSRDTRGEVMIAAGTAMRFSDNYYAQWSVLNIPFRELKDLLFADLASGARDDSKASPWLSGTTSQLFWRRLGCCQERISNWRPSRIMLRRSNLAMVEAHAAVVDGYLSGELVLGRDEVPTDPEDA